MNGSLTEFIAEQVEKVAVAREHACEAAVQSGGYGVLETWSDDGSVTFTLSADVPYGQIHVKGWLG